MKPLILLSEVGPHRVLHMFLNPMKKSGGSISCKIMKRLICTNTRFDLIKATFKMLFNLKGPLNEEFACFQSHFMMLFNHPEPYWNITV